MKTLRLAFVILRGAVTILAGAVPATYLCFFAYLVLMFGFYGVLAGDVMGFVLILWALAGFHGTLSLWAVGFGFVRGWSVAGLLLGTAHFSRWAGLS